MLHVQQLAADVAESRAGQAMLMKRQYNEGSKRADWEGWAEEKADRKKSVEQERPPGFTTQSRQGERVSCIGEPTIDGVTELSTVVRILNGHQQWAPKATWEQWKDASFFFGVAE